MQKKCWFWFRFAHTSAFLTVTDCIIFILSCAEIIAEFFSTLRFFYMFSITSLICKNIFTILCQRKKKEEENLLEGTKLTGCMIAGCGDAEQTHQKYNQHFHIHFSFCFKFQIEANLNRWQIHIENVFLFLSSIYTYESELE